MDILYSVNLCFIFVSIVTVGVFVLFPMIMLLTTISGLIIGKKEHIS
ncbi:hypothetical protein HDF26_004707 [Pedobacter cryoconitis]|nr:hypothetical protein [Pedobacter cryoconitis]